MEDFYDYRLIRPDDLFVAQITLTNLVVDQERRRLVRVTPGEPANVELELPTQHYAEPSFDMLTAEGWVPDVIPIFAGSRTRIEYTAPDGIDEFTFDQGGIVGAVCDWATNPGGTWIDVLSTLWLLPPHRLRIAIDGLVGSGPVPLWSADAGITADRPVVLKEYGAGWNLPAGRYGTQPDGSPGPVMRPVRHPPWGWSWRCSRLVLTPLGGTVSIEGPDHADGPYPAWGQAYRTRLGRTTYARQAVSGHLSSGHAATLVRVAERGLESVWSSDLTGEVGDVYSPVAMLQETTTLVVTEPHVDLAAEGAGHGPSAFTGLYLATGERRVLAGDLAAVDWMRSENGFILFDLIATDHAGAQVSLRMPLAFIPQGTPPDTAAAFVSGADVPAPTMATQSVAVAPGNDTAVTVRNVRPVPVTARSRPVIPVVKQMEIVVDQLAGLMPSPPTANFRFHDLYNAAGLDTIRNPQGALLQVIAPAGSQQLGVPLKTAALGAVGNPGLKVGALTTRAGAVASELARQATPSVDDIKSAFPNAKLFGSVDLLALLADEPFPKDGDNRTQLPAVRHRRTAAGDEFTYAFTAELKAQRTATTVVGSGARLTLSSTVTRRADGSVVSTSSGTVTNIGLTLFDVVTLRFSRVEFRSDAGTTTFAVENPELEFGAELQFVATLAEELKQLGQGSGVRVDVDGDGVTAGFGLEIPTVSLMALQFSNLTVDAWLRLPFTGAPMAFTLAVASRERPFLVTVSMFGGGGWLALEVSPAGIRHLELGIEFGGSISLDIVVASGGVSVMAGIYIAWNADERRTSFRAYLRASGHVSVLGIITVFVEFVLELGYDERPLTAGGKTYAIFHGRASVTVGVEVLFFSKSVTLTIERSFVGSELDPTFLDCFDLADWDSYCDAFAAEAAMGGGG